MTSTFAASATVEVRAFAAARAALGASALTVAVPVDAAGNASVADVLAAVLRAAPSAADVVARCSVLVGGVRSEPAATVPDGAVVDLLPPFAGG